MAHYEFDFVRTANGSLELDEPENVALIGFTDEGTEFYLIIKTEIGLSHVFFYGPIIPDLEELPQQVNCYFEEKETSENYINKTINTFLCKNRITQYEISDIETIKSRVRNLIDYV